MPARLEVNLKNLKNNVFSIKKYMKSVNSSNVELLAMVKADSYGAGILEVSKALEEIGVNYLGVAYLKEAKLLRQNGIKSGIVVFSGLLPEELEAGVKLECSYAISNIEIATSLNNIAKKYDKKVKVHIAIDTGMGRIGVLPKDISSFASKIKELENLEVEGIFSHFSSADTDISYTNKQNNIFKECIEEIEKAGIKAKFIHICNSVGITNFENSYNNMVRLGIGMYGYLDKKQTQKNGINLKGIFRLSAPICDIRKIEKGSAIGYSGTYITDRETVVATLQIGYADGLNRALSNKYVLDINGKKAKILGNICMDMTMIDVTDVVGLKVGDYVNIFDFEDGKLNEIADICNTINYEIISTIGKRVERIYIE